MTFLAIGFVTCTRCCTSLAAGGLESNGKKTKTIEIKCVGDSVTEGMSLEDHHTAVVGGSTYPSLLLTMLNENGINAKVENAGHGGEQTSAIVARLGVCKMTFSEDFTFNSEGCIGPINDKIIADYGKGLQIPITFSYTLTDINPVIINGKQYIARVNVTQDKKRLVYLYKDANDNTAVIKKGSTIKLIGGVNNNSINIIFAGINDNKTITIDQYIAMLKKGAEAKGKKYIILGPHSNIYEREGFVSGATTEERRQNYRNRMQAEFGNHFIDLNNDWYERALPIALESGFFADLNQNQIKDIQLKLNNRTIPGAFTVNGKDYNVHLNRAGYTVIARLVYERLQLLSYI